MLNFTVGPVQSCDEICKEGANQIPYFRTSEFSRVMIENEQLICKYAEATEGSRTVFITGSGTASMEAVIMNCFSENDHVLIVNGGSFGQRFVDLCKLHKIMYTEIKLQLGESLSLEHLEQYEGKEYTALLVNIHETSTGVYYNPEMISTFCKKNKLFLVVDAVSSFLADDFKMKEWGVNVMLTGSQKALAVPPGISLIVMDEKAQKRVKDNKCLCLYFDLENALKNGERGQTPFTPAVGILLQINKRLRMIESAGGYLSEKVKIEKIAKDFREKVKDIPVSFFSKSMSNAVTALKTRDGVDAYNVFEILKDEYDIWICPNGGEIGHKIFRVGHIGALTYEDNDRLISALKDLEKRGIL